MKIRYIKIASLVFFLMTSFLQIHAQEKQDPAPTVKELSIQEGKLSNASLDKSTKEDNMLSRGSSPTSGNGTDIGITDTSPFQLGGNIQGAIQNSVNQVTGKVVFGVPLASIKVGTVQHSINLAFNGDAAFKIGKELNKYNPTSIVGVGWSLNSSRILVDNKQTATRDDDEFFLSDGSANTKLICTNREEYFWEFQMENYQPWKIKYHIGFSEYDDIINPPQFVFRESDYWTITKDDGQTYFFGYSNRSQWNAPAPSSLSKSKEHVVAWGNWIGDSKKPNGVNSTIVWNLSRIKDQWNNTLDFEYELQEVNQSGSTKQTEAAYIKKIVSSKGASIQVSYSNKLTDEYYEPHTEINEPDAYQERYEKKFVNGVDIYNNSNEITDSYSFGYTINGPLGNKKRYLTSLIKAHIDNGQSFPLPPQEFKYNYSGTYKGGLNKIIYPTGGSVKYVYDNKYMFDNGSNRFESTQIYPSGYQFYSSHVSDNYQLFVLRSSNPISGNKYRFKIYRYWWNGTKYESNEFTFPHLMEDVSTHRMKGFSATFQKDFYGFEFSDGGYVDFYFFHLEKNGRDWDYFHEQKYLAVSDDPARLVSGNEFMAYCPKVKGVIKTYVWNGVSWNFKQFNFSSGQNYFTAANNYILQVDINGGFDTLDSGDYHTLFYIHYLNSEKKWKTKSWTSKIIQNLSSMDDPSYLFGSNSIASFAADNNPEAFLRWDKDYNLDFVDTNVLGWQGDQNPITPSSNSMFTVNNWFYGMPYKSARFNGSNWSQSSLPSSSAYHAQLNFGEDMLLFQDHDMYSNNAVGYHIYDPNTYLWAYNVLNTTGAISLSKSNGINREFVVAGNKIYRKSTQGVPSVLFSQIGAIQYDNAFTQTDGLSHAFVKETNNNNFQQGKYIYVDKENGIVNYTNLNQYHLSGFAKFGGNTHFLSPKSIWLRSESSEGSFDPYAYRIIDDKLNQPVFNIVVSRIEMDDNNDNVRKTKYTYLNPGYTPNNNTPYYGEVITENIGYGLSSNGKIKKIYNTGATDLQMTALLLEEQILDENDIIQSKTTYEWSKYSKIANNYSLDVGLSHYSRLTRKTEEVFFNSNSMFSETTNLYNSLGQLIAVETTNSKGFVELNETIYAHEQYSYLYDKNMLVYPYENTIKLDNQVVNINRNVWTEVSGNAYIKDKYSGPNSSLMRLNNQISHMDGEGNLIEGNNGKGIYNCSLNGYNNTYQVATIVNAKYQDVIDELDVTYDQLQNLDTENLKIELLKLYDRLSKAMITISLYDENGRIINEIDERQEETFLYYDQQGRLDYITDSAGNVLQKSESNFGN